MDWNLFLIHLMNEEDLVTQNLECPEIIISFQHMLFFSINTKLYKKKIHKGKI